MIQANELRIGNWLQYKEFCPNEKYFIVKSILGHGINMDGYTVISPSSYEPIFLTPEILEKCGFQLSKGKLSLKFYKNPKRGRIVNLYKVSDGYRYLNTRGVGPSPHINYLHQLQNLYFALTGTELEITL